MQCRFLTSWGHNTTQCKPQYIPKVDDELASMGAEKAKIDVFAIIA